MDQCKPLAKGCCALAARGGHLKVLKWLRQHNCPWDWETTHVAWENGHEELWHWPVDHGCSESDGNESDVADSVDED
jgi:hypothetical protein